MIKLMEKLYDNLNEAQAFALSFTNFVHIYDDMCVMDFTSTLCERCDKEVQTKDYLIPKTNCKKPYGILSTGEFGVSKELHDELIERFDITEKDFRPIRNKKGIIIFYQITPQHTMLPLCKENGWLPSTPCTKCGAVRYIDHEFENAKGEFYYYISQEALNEMHDFNITYEKFDCYMPLYVVSRRVYDFLVEQYPRTHYFPFYLKQVE